jgi:hypothetical protein
VLLVLQHFSIAPPFDINNGHSSFTQYNSRLDLDHQAKISPRIPHNSPQKLSGAFMAVFHTLSRRLGFLFLLRLLIANGAVVPFRHAMATLILRRFNRR